VTTHPDEIFPFDALDIARLRGHAAVVEALEG
jgi:hypothetical protein